MVIAPNQALSCWFVNLATFHGDAGVAERECIGWINATKTVEAASAFAHREAGRRGGIPIVMTDDYEDTAGTCNFEEY